LTIVTAVDALIGNACTSFIVTAAASPERYGELLRVLVRRALPVLVLGVSALVLAAPLVLAVFGPDYVEGGTTVMRLLALTTLSSAAVSLFNSTSRLRGRGRPILLRQVLGGTTLVTGTLVLAPRLGLPGVGLAWVISSAVVMATVVGPLRRELTSGALVLGERA
jgi:O-antigen/teichoic acid export membrane protein